MNFMKDKNLNNAIFQSEIVEIKKLHVLNKICRMKYIEACQNGPTDC